MKKKSYQVGDRFEYRGKHYVAMAATGRKCCEKCAFGNPATNGEAEACVNHCCEADAEQVIYKEVK